MNYQIKSAHAANQTGRNVISEREYRHYKWKMRRQRQIRNRILLFVFTICLIIGIALSYHSIISRAETNAENDNLSFKYYTEIEVQYGDSLWSLANAYADDYYNSTRTYIQEVKSINHLQSDLIKEGQKLIVPYYSSDFLY